MCTPGMDDQEYDGEGRLWIVVGGEELGGILVRKGQSLRSELYTSKLRTGTTVMELEVVGNRLHYKRIRGDGPDWGWVNVRKDESKALLELDDDPSQFLRERAARPVDLPRPIPAS